ncbi:probable polyamine oxidase 5 [Aricia agestis]|uniref:probable polyamine oxidase 5 n=1 Tax=Aricia agestis TaxID=91739 RepID=UPI001C207875|nr:probable polyamine oxidase 5 [Aricia agestis]
MANTKLCLFLFTVCLSCGLCKPNMSNSYDTIVVGMGAAGVTAAATLAKAGRRVLGLEADDRIGGRVKTVPFGDGVVEVGAEWIHGTVNSRVYDAAVQHNVSTVEQSLSSEVFRSDGSYGNRDLFNELTKFCIEIVEQSSDTPEPLGQFVTARLMEYLKKNHPDVLKDQDFVTEFLEVMNLFTNNHESSNDWNDVTTHTTYEVLGGHLHASWHKHGYKTFFEILLNKYNNGSGLPSLDIKLNKEVTQIKWPKDSTGGVEVVCKDGEKFTASNVIVTVSVGVLKERYSQLFSPLLPQEKIDMIQTIPIGVMDKVILKFDQPWWKSIPYTFMFFLWKGQDKKQVSDEDYWTTRIFGCSTPMGSKNALTLWTSGDVGKLVETLPEDVVIKKSVALLRKFMGANFTIPEPTGMVRSTWYSNPFTRGSYSYDNLAMPQHPDARSVLRQPLLDAAGTPRVLFAGEATDLTHFSTVHGASDSGYREAMRLLPASKI